MLLIFLTWNLLHGVFSCSPDPMTTLRLCLAVWHLYCLSSVKEGQELWIWKPDLLVLLDEVVRCLCFSCAGTLSWKERGFWFLKRSPCKKVAASYCHKRRSAVFQKLYHPLNKRITVSTKQWVEKWLHFRVKTGYSWADKSLQPCRELHICKWILMDTFIYPGAIAEGSEFAGAPKATWEPCRSNGHVKWGSCLDGYIES